MWEALGLNFLVSAGSYLFNLGMDIATSAMNEIYLNKWRLTYLGLANSLFFYLFGLVAEWLVFPPLFKWGIKGVWTIKNLSWLVGNWQSEPIGKGARISPPNITVSTSN